MGSRLLLLVLLAASGGAAAQAHRCVGDDGSRVYTDKACATVGAHDPVEAVTGYPMQAYRNGCVRSLREFTYELSSAIEAGDTNRLAALYRWNGTPTRVGYALMSRLEEITSRPLLGILPVYPRPVDTDPIAGATTYAGAATYAGAGDSLEDPVDDPLAVPLADPFPLDPPRRGPPIALRLDQTLANGITPAPTTLRLQRGVAGCWWVSL